MKKPFDVANGMDLRNNWKVILCKVDEGEIEHTALFYPTKEKAEEVAAFMNSTLSGTYSMIEQYIVKPHNPYTYVSHRHR